MFLALTLVLPLLAQQKPDYDMGKMQMVFVVQSPTWQGDRAPQIYREQRAYVESLVVDRKLALAGEVADGSELREVIVIKTEFLEEASRMAESFPAVKAGMLRTEVVTWYAARNIIKPPLMPLMPSSYILGVLVRGPKWKKDETDETKKIQAGHMANIQRLADTGKLVLAGPFIDGGDRRGVFIFKTDSLGEAQALTDTDPAVIAGRLKVVLRKWSVPKGMLP